LATAQAKAQATAEAEAKARAKAEAKAQGKAAAEPGSAEGAKRKAKLFGVLLVLAILGLAAFYQLVHQPLVDQVKILTETSNSQTARIRGLTGQLAQFQRDQGQVEELKALRGNLRNDLQYYSSEMAKYPGDAIYYQLAASVVAETRLLDALVMERINALEAGAKIEIVIPQTKPDEALAQELEGQMSSLAQLIADTERTIDPSDNSMEAQERRLALANERVTLATLRRSYFIAKYGLSAPYSASAGADQRVTPPSR
jgi:hypothetical protein